MRAGRTDLGALRSAGGREQSGQIWDYTARESGSLDIADRLIDSLTERFYLLSIHPYLGRCRDEELRAGMRSFLSITA